VFMKRLNVNNDESDNDKKLKCGQLAASGVELL
jgi:hypothetical protein